MRYRMLTRAVLQLGVSAAAMALAVPAQAAPGLPFTEPFDDTSLSDGGTTAAWGTPVAGELRLPTANPLMNVFGPTTPAEVLPGAFTTRALKVADMDGDGDLDLIEGAAGTSGVYLNDGTGVFAARVDLTATPANTRSVAIGDVDGDGDLDIVTGDLSARSRLHLNAGDGVTFTSSDITPDIRRTDSIVLVDLDSDGLLDVVTGNQLSQRNRIYMNTGDPLQPFGVSGVAGRDLSITNDNTQALLAGDLDNDGDVDLISLNEDQVDRVHLNDGLGTFATSSLSADADDTQAGALGDLNGDGFLDLVVGNTRAGQLSKIYFNNGTAAPFAGATGIAFTAVNDPDFAHSILLHDADQDGDLDIFLSTAGPIVPAVEANRLYLNDGTGTFGASVAIGAELDVTNVGAVGDVDGDGDLDYIAGNEARDAGGTAIGAENRLYRNMGTGAGGPAVLQLNAVATSLRVDTEAAPIVSVRLGALPASYGAHNDVDFWVSSNAGVSWVHIVPSGRPVLFPPGKQGQDLRWRGFLSSLSPAGVTGAAALALDNVTLALNVSGPALVTPVGDQSATQGTPFAVTIAFSDGDGDPVFHALTGAPAGTGLSINPMTGEVSGTPTNADTVGSPLALTVVATDGALRSEQGFNLTVADVNDPPVFTSTPVTAATQDVAYTYAVTASDPDPVDVLTITAVAIPAWLTLTDNGGGAATLSGTPGVADVGDHTVSLQVSDAMAATALQDFTVSVAAAGTVNGLPTFTSTAPTTATEGTEYVYAITATDPEAGMLTITAPTLPAWLTFTDAGNGTAELRGTPGAANVGDHAVALQVDDAAAATASQSFSIAVAAAAPPPAPAPNPTPTPAPASQGGDSGGGSTALELLALAALAAVRFRRRWQGSITRELHE